MTVPAEELTRTAFAPYGSVAQASSLARSNVPGDPPGVPANQGSAIKYADISPLRNEYHRSGSQWSARPCHSLFVCSPRKYVTSRPAGRPTAELPLRVVERHPYTTQTFSPMGLDPGDKSTLYVVVVTHSVESLERGPSLDGLKAFVARGDQAVTYGVGVWHSPMIVVGEKPVSFLVTQFANGVPEDDCQEHYYHQNKQEIKITFPPPSRGNPQQSSKL